MISYAMLAVLHNNTVAAKKVTRKYEKQFARDGAKIGDTFSIRKPPRYVTVDGPTFQPQNYEDERVNLTVNQHKQVGCEWGNDDLTLSMDDFVGRFLEPSLVPLANSVDVAITSLFPGVWNATGTPGTVAATDTPFVDARALLVDNAAQANTEWPMLVTPRVSARLSSGLAGRFNPQAKISDLYEKGMMGPALGFNFYETQNMQSHVTGAWAANVANTGIQVDGAGQTGNSILFKGAGSSVTNIAKTGDVIQIDGVFMVNPITKANTGNLQNFRLTADASSSGTALTLKIDPPIILVGKNQTVSASPADSAQLFVWGTQTVADVGSKTSPQNMAWSSDGITLACVDLAMPGQGEGVKAVRVSDDDLGLSLLYMSGFDPREYSAIKRVDILFGTVLTRPEHVVRIAS